ncbi:MAG TPA: protein-methionine-sulfoxide reductase catalytic subunit MsrP [Anaerolineaceae bacterium]|nr:protein-methionine-sulfoxide reductase catalytic subunit MsrP [Anaerolineaceae bacterium]
MNKIPSSEITPENVYMSRRSFLKRAGLLAAAAAALAACKPQGAVLPPADATPPSASGQTDELGDALTDYQDVTTYNNFYEFSLDKEAVARLSEGWITSPWSVTVGGLVNRPKTYDVDDLRRLYDEEERIYRMRCVEGWSMVIPWLGFPLSKLLKDVEPTGQARYVRFESVYDPAGLPGQRDPWFNWPYVEGLRLDEAMHDLTILSTGLYGKTLLPQNGAPLRLVVPWKYGFKSIKSIVKIELVEEMPSSLWMDAAPSEYGFYANVNPDVAHPRWSQATERRIGDLGRRDTLLFNGYEEAVASLYSGMDLRQNY